MSMLKNLFGNKNKVNKAIDIPTDIDIHSHLIPGIDDGSENMTETISLLRKLRNMGYKKVITTPHIMSDFFKNTPEIIRDGLANVKEAMKENQIEMEIDIAAEYYVDDVFMDKISKGEELLTFGDKYVLIETNTVNYTDVVRNAIWELNLAGYKPVYAHPERYTYFYKNFDSYRKIKDMGVFFQINLPSLGGFYNPNVQKMAERLIDENMVEFIGSDAHEIRYLEAMQKAQYSVYMDKLAKMDLLNKTL